MTDPARYGPWAVIVGGSEGVGASFARQLADAGLNLVLVARKPAPLGATADEARARGVRVRTVALDIVAADALRRIREATDDVEVGLLIFNAGANSYGHEFVTGDLERARGVIDLNITARLAVTHHFGARMKERGAAVRGFGPWRTGRAGCKLRTVATAAQRSCCGPGGRR